MVNNGMKRAKILFYILTLGFITPIGIIVGMVLTLQAENAVDTTQSMAVGVLQVTFACLSVRPSVHLSVCPSVRPPFCYLKSVEQSWFNHWTLFELYVSMYFTINDKKFSVDQERTHQDMGLLCLKNTSWFICLYPYY